MMTVQMVVLFVEENFLRSLIIVPIVVLKWNGVIVINTEVMFSSQTDQWSTPQDFFDKLNEEFHFTLDPCADEYNHKCEKYYTKEQDGLRKLWGGRECSATHRMVEKSVIGLRSVIWNLKTKILFVLC